MIRRLIHISAAMPPMASSCDTVCRAFSSSYINDSSEYRPSLNYSSHNAAHRHTAMVHASDNSQGSQHKHSFGVDVRGGKDSHTPSDDTHWPVRSGTVDTDSERDYNNRQHPRQHQPRSHHSNGRDRPSSTATRSKNCRDRAAIDTYDNRDTKYRNKAYNNHLDEAAEDETDRHQPEVQSASTLYDSEACAPPPSRNIKNHYANLYKPRAQAMVFTSTFHDINDTELKTTPASVTTTATATTRSAKPAVLHRIRHTTTPAPTTTTTTPPSYRVASAAGIRQRSDATYGGKDAVDVDDVGTHDMNLTGDGSEGEDGTLSHEDGNDDDVTRIYPSETFRHLADHERTSHRHADSNSSNDRRKNAHYNMRSYSSSNTVSNGDSSSLGTSHTHTSATQEGPHAPPPPSPPSATHEDDDVDTQESMMPTTTDPDTDEFASIRSHPFFHELLQRVDRHMRRYRKEVRASGRYSAEVVNGAVRPLLQLTDYPFTPAKLAELAHSISPVILRNSLNDAGACRRLHLYLSPDTGLLLDWSVEDFLRRRYESIHLSWESMSVVCRRFGWSSATISDRDLLIYFGAFSEWVELAELTVSANGKAQAQRINSPAQYAASGRPIASAAQLLIRRRTAAADGVEATAAVEPSLTESIRLMGSPALVQEQSRKRYTGANSSSSSDSAGDVFAAARRGAQAVGALQQEKRGTRESADHAERRLMGAIDAIPALRQATHPGGLTIREFAITNEALQAAAQATAATHENANRSQNNEDARTNTFRRNDDDDTHERIANNNDDTETQANDSTCVAAAHNRPVRTPSTPPPKNFTVSTSAAASPTSLPTSSRLHTSDAVEDLTQMMSNVQTYSRGVHDTLTTAYHKTKSEASMLRRRLLNTDSVDHVAELQEKLSRSRKRLSWLVDQLARMRGLKRSHESVMEERKQQQQQQQQQEESQEHVREHKYDSIREVSMTSRQLGEGPTQQQLHGNCKGSDGPVQARYYTSHTLHDKHNSKPLPLHRDHTTHNRATTTNTPTGATTTASHHSHESSNHTDSICSTVMNSHARDNTRDDEPEEEEVVRFVVPTRHPRYTIAPEHADEFDTTDQRTEECTSTPPSTTSALCHTTDHAESRMGHRGGEERRQRVGQSIKMHSRASNNMANHNRDAYHNSAYEKDGNDCAGNTTTKDADTVDDCDDDDDNNDDNNGGIRVVDAHHEGMRECDDAANSSQSHGRTGAVDETMEDEAESVRIAQAIRAYDAERASYSHLPSSTQNSSATPSHNSSHNCNATNNNMSSATYSARRGTYTRPEYTSFSSLSNTSLRSSDTGAQFKDIPSTPLHNDEDASHHHTAVADVKHNSNDYNDDKNSNNGDGASYSSLVERSRYAHSTTRATHAHSNEYDAHALSTPAGGDTIGQAQARLRAARQAYARAVRDGAAAVRRAQQTLRATRRALAAVHGISAEDGCSVDSACQDERRSAMRSSATAAATIHEGNEAEAGDGSNENELDDHVGAKRNDDKSYKDDDDDDIKEDENEHEVEQENMRMTDDETTENHAQPKVSCTANATHKHHDEESNSNGGCGMSKSETTCNDHGSDTRTHDASHSYEKRASRGVGATLQNASASQAVTAAAELVEPTTPLSTESSSVAHFMCSPEQYDGMQLAAERLRKEVAVLEQQMEEEGDEDDETLMTVLAASRADLEELDDCISSVRQHTRWAAARDEQRARELANECAQRAISATGGSSNTKKTMTTTQALQEQVDTHRFHIRLLEKRLQRCSLAGVQRRLEQRIIQARREIGRLRVEQDRLRRAGRDSLGVPSSISMAETLREDNQPAQEEENYDNSATSEVQEEVQAEEKEEADATVASLSRNTEKGEENVNADDDTYNDDIHENGKDAKECLREHDGVDVRHRHSTKDAMGASRASNTDSSSSSSLAVVTSSLTRLAGDDPTARQLQRRLDTMLADIQHLQDSIVLQERTADYDDAETEAVLLEMKDKLGQLVKLRDDVQQLLVAQSTHEDRRDTNSMTSANSIDMNDNTSSSSSSSKSSHHSSREQLTSTGHANRANELTHDSRTVVSRTSNFVPRHATVQQGLAAGGVDAMSPTANATTRRGSTSVHHQQQHNTMAQDHAQRQQQRPMGRPIASRR